MQPTIYFITLVAADLGRSLAFYRDGLGLRLAAGGPPGGAATFAKFDLQPGLSLVLVTEEQFEEFTGLDIRGARASQVALSIPLPSEPAVRETYASALAHGGRSLMPPARQDWGYVATLRDPDSNVIELVADPEAPGLEAR